MVLACVFAHCGFPDAVADSVYDFYLAEGFESGFCVREGMNFVRSVRLTSLG